jgi:hypothetical protein
VSRPLKEEKEPEDVQQEIKKRTARTILELLAHTLVMGISLGSIWAIHLILEGLLGHDARFFDLIPIRWIIDLADLAIIGKFIWELIMEFQERKQR